MVSNRREPALGEMLEDPIVVQLMLRDGVGRDELLDLLDRARIRLKHQPGRIAGRGFQMWDC